MKYRTEQAQRAEVCPKTKGPMFHCTDRKGEVNKLFIIWPQKEFSAVACLAFVGVRLLPFSSSLSALHKQGLSAFSSIAYGKQSLSMHRPSDFKCL